MLPHCFLLAAVAVSLALGATPSGVPIQGPAPSPAAEAPQATEAAASPLVDHKRLALAMQRLASEHTDLVSVLNVGHSRDGRMFEAVRIAKGEIGAGRPAILVVANLDGPLVYTSAIALDLARSLAESAATHASVARMLERTTVYVIPRANPDGAEARFLAPLQELRATGHDADDDRDGRLGEDPPSDVNGDGMVAWMKVPHSEGTWLDDPTDPRVPIAADRAKGQRGVYKYIREGRDSDHDEEASEDAAANAVVNRNFPQDWREHDLEAGVFATDEPEARALCEFVLSKKDIQLVVVLGETDTLVEKPKSAPDKDGGGRGELSSAAVLESDAKLLEKIAERWKEITDTPAKGGTDLAGSFQAWCYAQSGLLTVSLNPWTIPLDGEKGGKDEKDGEKKEEAQTPEDDEKKPKEPEPSDDAKRLAWIDAHPEIGVARFLPWTPYQHPELGAVEVGGFAPYGTIEPPAARRAELVGETRELVLALDEMLARVTIADAKIQELTPGIIEVKATVVNESYLPLLTAAARRARAMRGARVEIFLPKEATLLAGKRQELLFDVDGAGGRHEMRWLVQGGSPLAIGVSVSTDHAGSARYQEAR